MLLEAEIEAMFYKDLVIQICELLGSDVLAFEVPDLVKNLLRKYKTEQWLSKFNSDCFEMTVDQRDIALTKCANLEERIDAVETEARALQYNFEMMTLRAEVAESALAQAMQTANYYQLLYAVGNKYEGETRHETALRYIKQAEKQDVVACCSEVKSLKSDRSKRKKR